jgi:hypothetical protein
MKMAHPSKSAFPPHTSSTTSKPTVCVTGKSGFGRERPRVQKSRWCRFPKSGQNPRFCPDTRRSRRQPCSPSRMQRLSISHAGSSGAGCQKAACPSTAGPAAGQNTTGPVSSCPKRTGQMRPTLRKWKACTCHPL